MLALTPFQEISNLKISIMSDLQLVDHQIVDIFFEWKDIAKQIIFPTTPLEGRHMNLWQNTCFEVFLQPDTLPLRKYFEVNLSVNKAWNVFAFEDYRTPQPPTEFVGAEILKFKVDSENLKVRIKFNGLNFTKLKVSCCAVVALKDLGTTYWSIKHADQKPNFHHFESFITERAI